MDKTIIAVFCYKRAAKLKTSMEALLQNPECASMDVIFFCDGPKNDVDAPGVQATRAYIDTITGFKNVYKYFHEKNVSTGPNFREGITYLCDHYDQFIVVEDDLVVSPNYIRYMLDALNYYQKELSVFCITGYCFPIQKNSYSFDTLVHTRFCSYGWGSWSDRVNQVTWDQQELLHLMNTSPDFKTRLNKEGMDLYRMLKKQILGTISTWDIQMQVHVAEHRMKVIYPVLSKTKNIGFDQESTNTFGIDYLQTVTDRGEKRNFGFCPPNMEVPFLQKQLKKPYGLPALASRKIRNTVIKLADRVKKPT